MSRLSPPAFRSVRFARRRGRRAGSRREGGQAAFEFLLILPIFVLFVLMLIDFGVIMYGYVSVANAAREGARFASVNCGDGSCDPADVEALIISRSSGFLDDSSGTTIDVIWDGRSRGDAVTVTAVRCHGFLFIPWSIEIGSSAAMRLEQTDTGSGNLAGEPCSP